MNSEIKKKKKNTWIPDVVLLRCIENIRGIHYYREDNNRNEIPNNIAAIFMFIIIFHFVYIYRLIKRQYIYMLISQEKMEGMLS